jgi:hypothetical protein
MVFYYIWQNLLWALNVVFNPSTFGGRQYAKIHVSKLLEQWLQLSGTISLITITKLTVIFPLGTELIY